MKTTIWNGEERVEVEVDRPERKVPAWVRYAMPGSPCAKARMEQLEVRKQVSGVRCQASGGDGKVVDRSRPTKSPVQLSLFNLRIAG